MQGLYTETKTLRSSGMLPLELALDIYMHRFNGSVAVVADHPKLLMTAVKREWLKLIKKTQKEPKERTDDEIGYLRNFTFVTTKTDDGWRGNVFFSTPLEFKKMPPDCRRLYVTCKVSKEDIYMITSWMPHSSTICIYN